MRERHSDSSTRGSKTPRGNLVEPRLRAVLVAAARSLASRQGPPAPAYTIFQIRPPLSSLT
jgi:hypothetical protein